MHRDGIGNNTVLQQSLVVHPEPFESFGIAVGNHECIVWSPNKAVCDGAVVEITPDNYTVTPTSMLGRPIEYEAVHVYVWAVKDVTQVRFTRFELDGVSLLGGPELDTSTRLFPLTAAYTSQRESDLNPGICNNTWVTHCPAETDRTRGLVVDVGGGHNHRRVSGWIQVSQNRVETGAVEVMDENGVGIAQFSTRLGRLALDYERVTDVVVPEDTWIPWFVDAECTGLTGGQTDQYDGQTTWKIVIGFGDARFDLERRLTLQFHRAYASRVVESVTWGPIVVAGHRAYQCGCTANGIGRLHRAGTKLFRMPGPVCGSPLQGPGWM